MPDEIGMRVYGGAMKRSTVLRTMILVFAIAWTAAPAHTAPRVVEKEKDKIWQVTVDAVPKTLDAFMSFRDAIAKTPQGGIVVYLVAQLIMMDNPELGEQCLIVALDRSQLAEHKPGSRAVGVQGWQLGGSEKTRLGMSTFIRAKGYVAKSFVAGTSTATGYALPSLPYTYVIRKHKFQDANPSVWKGNVATSCSDLGTVPIHVTVNDRGVWKVSNSSSFYAGCKPPTKKVDDNL